MKKLLIFTALLSLSVGVMMPSATVGVVRPTGSKGIFGESFIDRYNSLYSLFNSFVAPVRAEKFVEEDGKLAPTARILIAKIRDLLRDLTIEAQINAGKNVTINKNNGELELAK